MTDQYKVVYSDDKKELIRAVECTEQSYTVAEGTQTIQTGAFAFNDTIREIILPKSVKIIEKNAFASCDNLEHVDMSRCKVKVIPDNCFYWSKSLKRIELPNTVTELKDGAFASSSLEEVDFGIMFPKVKKWGTNLFELSEIRIAKDVPALTSGMFQNCYNLTDVELIEGITEIPDKAFFRCEKLERIVLPDTIEKIGFWALKECPLKEITLSANLREFPCDAVEWSAMQNVISHNADFIVERNAVWNPDMTILYKFWGKELPTVDHPITIRWNACEANNRIETVSIQKGTKLWHDCFAKCSNLRTAIIASNYIPIHGFEKCCNLSVVVLNGCSHLEAHAFAGCENLITINTEGVTTIGERCFENCKLLREITFGPGIERIEDGFYGCDSLEVIRFTSLPQGDLTVSKPSFEPLVQLREIQIPMGSLKAFKKFIPKRDHALLKER